MKLNIHYKITFVFAIVLTIILLGIFFYLNQRLRKDTYQRIEENIKKQIALAKSYLEDSPAGTLHNYQLDKVADKIGKSLGLRVTIINLDGTVFGDSELDGERLVKLENHLHRPEVQQALKTGIGQSRRFSTTVKKYMLYVASVFGGKIPQGVIRLSIPLSEIELISNRLKNTLIFSLISAFVAAIIIGFFLSGLISRPIKEISAAAKEIARGNFPKQIQSASNDEIGSLSKAFDYMSKQIKQRLEELNLSRSRLEAVFASMVEGVVVVDSKGRIILMNEALKKLLQVKDRPAGKKPIEVARNVEIQELADSVLKGKSKVRKCEISIFTPQEKILSIQAAAVMQGGDTEGAVLVFHDITHLRRLEKIRRDFVANVSHELRTPISSIKGYAETLLERALDDRENAKDFLKIIYTDSERLARLVEDLLDLSKIESGKLKMNCQPLRIKPLITKVVSSLKRQAERKHILIKVSAAEDLPFVYADEGKISQVLLNLIDNAIKYNKEGGTVVISGKDKGRFVHIDISDTGIGIPERDLPRLFERFYRVDKARSRQLGGTGLGLSIVKHIISAHRGKVFARSILGRGSTFSFTLPKV